LADFFSQTHLITLNVTCVGKAWRLSRMKRWEVCTTCLPVLKFGCVTQIFFRKSVKRQTTRFVSRWKFEALFYEIQISATCRVCFRKQQGDQMSFSNRPKCSPNYLCHIL
jgi:hypothetical protein